MVEGISSIGKKENNQEFVFKYCTYKIPTVSCSMSSNEWVHTKEFRKILNLLMEHSNNCFSCIYFAIPGCH